MIKKAMVILLMGLVVFSGILLFGGDETKTETKAKTAKKEHKQLIIWSSGERDVALKLVFMYSFYSHKQKWMDHVRLLVWGPSAKLLSEDKELQDKIKDLKNAGVELWACKACADSYGVSKKLEAMGIKVHYTGKHLAEMQKEGWHVITF